MKANENYEIEVNDPKIETKKTEPGQFVTNCKDCNMTCHERCSICPPESKERCSVMVNGKCTICAKNCDHSRHENNHFYYVVTNGKKKTTLNELFKEY
jgi:hypothetical protein